MGGLLVDYHIMYCFASKCGQQNATDSFNLAFTGRVLTKATGTTNTEIYFYGINLNITILGKYFFPETNMHSVPKTTLL